MSYTSRDMLFFSRCTTVYYAVNFFFFLQLLAQSERKRTSKASAEWQIIHLRASILYFGMMLAWPIKQTSPDKYNLLMVMDFLDF